MVKKVCQLKVPEKLIFAFRCFTEGCETRLFYEILNAFITHPMEALPVNDARLFRES